MNTGVPESLTCPATGEEVLGLKAEWLKEEPGEVAAEMNEFAALSADQACITLKDQGKGASYKGNQCSIYQGNQRPPPPSKVGDYAE